MEGPEEAVALADTAKTESLGDRLLLWHFGHDAFSLPKTKTSNSWSQLLHAYSKIGISALR